MFEDWAEEGSQQDLEKVSWKETRDFLQKNMSHLFCMSSQPSGIGSSYFLFWYL